MNGGQGAGAASIRRKGKPNAPISKPVLDPDGSAALRDQLLTDVDKLISADAAATWAQQIMAAKNSLAAADAQRVEDAFAAKMATITSCDEEVINAPPSSSQPDQPRSVQNVPLGKPSQGFVSNRVDKSLLGLPEPRRFRDKTHVKFVAKQPCLVCGRQPSDAHHLRFAQHRALGRKVSDEFIVPLCRGHHREVHRSGDETSWWGKAGIDPIGAARTLWTETHPLRPVAKARNPDQVTASRAASIRFATAQPPPKSQNEANHRGGGSMSSFRQIDANRRNARKSTGPITEEGKQRSRCNAVRHGLTAETVIGALEDAEDYKAFEAAIIADYDVQSAVERELVLRLASLLWRLRRATTIETGLFEFQAGHLNGFRRGHHAQTELYEIIYAKFERADPVSFDEDPVSHDLPNKTEAVPSSGSISVGPAADPTADLARCFLRLANLPNLRSIASADTKQPFGGKPARSCLLSMHWIAVNHKREGAVFRMGSRQDLPADGRDDY